jgi:biotin carboxyl carrier protein
MRDWILPIAGGTSERACVAEEIRAEMVASVLSVAVGVGARVSDGDELVILESMKMEIPVITEVSGTVTAVAVAEGDVVQSGDLIAVVDGSEQGGAR